MFPSNEWDALAHTLGEINEVMIKVGKAEIFAYVCIAWSALMAIYFASVVLKQKATRKESLQVADVRKNRITDEGEVLNNPKITREKVVLNNFKTTNSEFKTIISPEKQAINRKTSDKNKVVYTDPEIEKILSEFRR